MKRPESKPSSWKQRWENWLVEGDAKKDTLAASDLAADAQWAASQQQAKGSRILLWSSLLCVLVLLIWASLGYIDEVVRGQGKVVPSRQVQVVQSLDGGVVEEILVRPGQRVDAGQVLLRLDPTRSTASLGENKAETLALKAKAARLEALATGEPFKAPDDVLKQAPNVVEMERRVWESKTQELQTAISIARDQFNQRQQELRETMANRDQAASSCSLTSEELRVTKPLLSSGAVSEVDLLR